MSKSSKRIPLPDKMRVISATIEVNERRLAKLKNTLFTERDIASTQETIDALLSVRQDLIDEKYSGWPVRVSGSAKFPF